MGGGGGGVAGSWGREGGGGNGVKRGRGGGEREAAGAVRERSGVGSGGREIGGGDGERGSSGRGEARPCVVAQILTPATDTKRTSTVRIGRVWGDTRHIKRETHLSARSAKQAALRRHVSPADDTRALPRNMSRAAPLDNDFLIKTPVNFWRAGSGGRLTHRVVVVRMVRLDAGVGREEWAGVEGKEEMGGGRGKGGRRGC